MTQHYKGTRFPKRPWTKEDVKLLISLWKNSDKKTLEERLQRPYSHIVTVVYTLRALGGRKIDLPKKLAPRSGVQSLIREVLAGL